MPERLVRQSTRDRVPRHALDTALPTPRVVLDDAAFDRGPIRSISWPTATRPSSSRRQNVVRSGVAKVGWSTSRSFGMASVKNFHHPGDLDPYPATDALNRYTLIRDEPRNGE